MSYIIGAAHTASGNTKAGDQKQTTTPVNLYTMDRSAGADYSGEVSLREKSNVAQVVSSYSGYWVYRPKNPAHGKAMARVMLAACNNPNVGYSQATDGPAASQRTGIFKYGELTTTPCNCDCSSLVSYCIQKGTGVNIFASTSGLSEQMNKSGLFNASFPIGGYTDATPPCTGDVLLKSGKHVEIVVKGADSTGAIDAYASLGLNSFGVNSGNVSFPMKDYIALGTDFIDTFIPRTREAVPGEEAYDKYYNQNYCESRNGSYAWGRFSEILGMECTLSKGMVRRWYITTEDGYDRGLSPALGAVMCYTNVKDKKDPGMACIVEGIGDGFVAVSWISVKTDKFEYTKITKKNGSWSVDIDGDGNQEYMFQGFIYNPNVQAGITTHSRFTDFIETAKQQVGDTGTFVKQQIGFSVQNNGWSGAFIVAVAKKVGGLLDVIIPNTTSCSSVGQIGVEKEMGNWLDGPLNDGDPYVQPGDIALFDLSSNTTRNNKYLADKAAIVISVDALGGDVDETNKNRSVKFTYVMGDSSGRVECKGAYSNTPTLVGIFRPNWDKVDLSSGVSKGTYNLQGLYQGASLEDAAIKDFKYIDVSSGEPSIQSTGLMLCAINYSGIIGSVYNIFASLMSSNANNPLMLADIFNGTTRTAYNDSTFDNITVLGDSAIQMLDLSALDGEINSTGSVKIGNETLTLTNTVKTIYLYLKNLFNNPAGAVGFMANMFAESRFRTSAVNSSSKASGLCQWLAGRRTKMVNHCLEYNGQSWENNLSGQLDYLAKELNESYKPTLNTCKNCSLNLAGAKVACDYVLKHFEIPGHYDVNTPLRAGYTEKIWELFFGGRTQ